MNKKRYISVLLMVILAILAILPQIAMAHGTRDGVTHDVTQEPSGTEEWSDPDYDWDGFLNEDDACPWAGNEGGLGVDEVGCPYYDTDWDGFFDRNDQCPWQGNEGGLGVDEVGCPYYDADWDGFYDHVDACPWEGDEYGAGVDDYGCPIPWGNGTEDPYSTEDPHSTEEPTATEPTATEPTATEPTATEPTATEPTATQPTATVPTPTEQTPTPPPPPRNECPADIMFAIDQSSSVNETEFIQQQNFVLGVLNAIPIGDNGAHVGFVYFSSAIFTQLDLPLTGDGASAISFVSSYIKEGGFTQQGIAINIAQTELATNGRPQIEDIIVVVTDGNPFDTTPIVDPGNAADTARTAGTTLFAVGVEGVDGSGNPELPDLATLQEIANDPDADFIAQITFDGIDDQNFINQIAGAICPPPENLPPVAVDDLYFTNQDTALEIPAPGVMTNDFDYDNDPLIVVDWTNPSFGSLTINEDGSFTYTPNAGFTGVDTFTYIITDDNFDSNTATVTIYVMGPEATEEPTATEPTATEPTATEPTATEPTPETTQVATEDPYGTEDPSETEEWSDPDYDWDGVLNEDDACPWEGDEGGLGVDETGCPYYDADWDGFYDHVDACPWQGDEGGLGVDEVGCPYYDADWDGFYDHVDACPWEGDEYGRGVDATGCPIPWSDSSTQEPHSTQEPYVTEEWSDPDYDWDGFLNANDACPWEGNEGGLGVDETGCPYYDEDWDGVYDRFDQCVYEGNEYGLGVDAVGCPIAPSNSQPYSTEDPYATQEP